MNQTNSSNHLFSNTIESTVQLEPELVVNLSSDNYDLTVVHHSKAHYKISSEEKIVFFKILPSLQQQFMERNMTVTYHYIFMVDVQLQWAIYCINNEDQSEGKEVFRGGFVSEKEELKKVVNVHEIGRNRIVVVFDRFVLFYLQLP